MIRILAVAVGLLLGTLLPSQLTTEYPIQYSKQINLGLDTRIEYNCDTVNLKLTYGLADTAKFTFFAGSPPNACIAWGPHVGSSPDTLY